METTYGPIDIELWGKEAPKATRNFIQLCMEGYYDDTIFHRIVKDFILQGGDPTGSGAGGESIWEEPFVDEFHSRLRFNRRGLLGMANGGSTDDNGSQFFFTLAATPELTRKNTLFGRIVGDTLYNMVRISELELDDNARPLYPAKITATKILENPFDDITPRTTKKEKIQRLEEQREAEASKELVQKAKKRKAQLLSFNDEDDGTVVVRKMKPLVPPPTPKDEKYEGTKASKSEIIAISMLESPVVIPEANQRRSVAPSPSPSSTSKKSEQLDKVNNQIAALKSSMKSLSHPKDYVEGHEKKQEKKSFAEEIRSGYERGGKRSRKRKEEGGLLEKLASFTDKLQSTQMAAPTEEAIADLDLDEGKVCELHGVSGCFSCFDRLGEEEESDNDPIGFLNHRLVFAQDKLGKDLQWKRGLC